MNAENLRTLAHELRADPDSYDQTTLGEATPCGTVACIAGHAARLAKKDGLSVPTGITDTAGEWLDLDSDESDVLFSANPDCCKGVCGRGWPRRWARRYTAALLGDTPESPAFVAADLLDALADGTVTL